MLNYDEIIVKLSHWYIVIIKQLNNRAMEIKNKYLTHSTTA